MGQVLLTEDQAAAQLNLCPRTLRKERQAGNLSYILVGRAVRYAPEDLTDFVDRKRQVNVQPVEVTQRCGRKASANRKSAVIVPFSAR